MAKGKCCKPRIIPTCDTVAFDIACSIIERADRKQRVVIRDMASPSLTYEAFEIRKNRTDRVLHVCVRQDVGKSSSKDEALRADCVVYVRRCCGSDKVIFKQKVTRKSIRSRDNLNRICDRIASRLMKLCGINKNK